MGNNGYNIDTEKLKRGRRTLIEEATAISDHINTGDKSRIVKIIDRISREVTEMNCGLEQYIKSAESLKSLLASMSSTMDNRKRLDKFSTRLSNYLTILYWYVLKSEGKEVGEEPWDLEEVEEESGEEEETTTLGNVPEEFIKDGDVL